MTQTAQLMQSAYNLHRAGRLGEAARLYSEVLRSEPNFFDALYLLGVTYSQSGRLAAALEMLDRAVRANPRSVEAAYAKALALHRMGHLHDAVAAYDVLLVLSPRSAEAHNNRGAALSALERHTEALASYDRAIAANPGFANAWNNRGNAFLLTAQPAEAIKNYDKTLALNPRHVDAHVNRGTALMQLSRFADAAASFSAALALDPDRIEAIEGRGRSLSDLHLYAEALPDLERMAIAAPQRADVWYNRANAYSVLKCYGEAVADAERALAIDPQYPFARGLAVHSKLQICDWSSLEEHTAALSEDLKQGRNTASPFELLAISNDPAEALRAATLWGRHLYPPQEPLWRGERYGHQRIRLAYLSADYRDHPVAFQMAGVFEAHDRSAFETIAFSFTPEYRSPLRTRLESAFDRFIDVREKSDLEIARMLRAMEIDIAIDLMGYTRDNRTGIFAHRPAPVQVNYLGYPGTMGLPYFDYIVGDSVTIPEHQATFYSENIVRLPDSFFPNDGRRPPPGSPVTRRAAGLPETGFVFCCFNGAHKISPAIFAVWMRILRAASGSILWFSQASQTAVANLKHAAAQAEINPARLVFAPFVDATEQHLARLALADLFLDSLPYGAHATACDALWAGVPVLPAPGSTFPGRVAASLMTAAGLPELVVEDLDDYEANAVRLSRDPPALAALRQALAKGRDARLFNTARSCRSLETAFRTMWQRAEAGEAHSAFAVPRAD